ncbi:MAG: CDP-diacylglycerol--serine O-phosphatidyltransferase [Candidatus Hatepunaea meridiana]|nr:CDP-diacylglycerol--serine O-phosphatidyltransferase [Candidatus Hatepunaea meridiana]
MYKKAMLPNTITIGNLFLGFYAILEICQGNYTKACWFIVIAAILDGLDGLVARLVHSDSKFGMEIDSLVDVVSFGVAPALLIYMTVFKPLGIIGITLAFLPLLAGALRLARYNLISISSPQKKGFIGLPLPSSALVIVGFYVYIHNLHGSVANQPLWFSIIPALSLLMISPIPYRRMPVVRIHGSKYPWIGVSILIITAFLMIWKPAYTLFPLMLTYVITGPIEILTVQLRKLRPQQSEDDVPETSIISPRQSSRRSRRRKR